MIDTQCNRDAGNDKAGGIVRHLTPLLPRDGQSVVGVAGIVLAAIGVAFFFWWLVAAVSRALFGFGIALEGVTRPGLYVGDVEAPAGSVALPTRALIVGAPDELRARFTGASGHTAVSPSGEPWTVIDLAGPFPAIALRGPPRGENLDRRVRP